MVHRGYAITRIRQFYMRKVKFTQTSWNEKLSRIWTTSRAWTTSTRSTPTCSTCCLTRTTTSWRSGNALNTARRIIDKIAKDYVKLLKYGGLSLLPTANARRSGACARS